MAIRLAELAKELGTTKRELMERLPAVGFELKKSVVDVDESLAEEIKSRLKAAGVKFAAPPKKPARTTKKTGQGCQASSQENGQGCQEGAGTDSLRGAGGRYQTNRQRSRPLARLPRPYQPPRSSRPRKPSLPRHHLQNAQLQASQNRYRRSRPSSPQSR